MKYALGLVAAMGIVAGGAVTVMANNGDDSVAEVKAVGEPIACVNTRMIQSTKVIDDKTIDFKMSGGRTYRNTLTHSCPSLKFEESFSYRLSGSQLCDVDIIRVLNNYGGRLEEGAGCGLGKFQQIEKNKAG